jgi:hypothetical protein
MYNIYIWCLEFKQEVCELIVKTGHFKAINLWPISMKQFTWIILFGNRKLHLILSGAIKNIYFIKTHKQQKCGVRGISSNCKAVKIWLCAKTYIQNITCSNKQDECKCPIQKVKWQLSCYTVVFVSAVRKKLFIWMCNLKPQAFLKFYNFSPVDPTRLCNTFVFLDRRLETLFREVILIQIISLFKFLWSGLTPMFVCPLLQRLCHKSLWHGNWQVCLHAHYIYININLILLINWLHTHATMPKFNYTNCYITLEWRQASGLWTCILSFCVTNNAGTSVFCVTKSVKC